jgi:hypothetical protein
LPHWAQPFRGEQKRRPMRGIARLFFFRTPACPHQ